jgi:hypothetical protein
MKKSTLFSCTILLLCAVAGAARGQEAKQDGLRFDAVVRSQVEKRLKEYEGSNDKREAVLLREFTEAGCKDTHLTEQPVKGVKQPNVVCALPGRTAKTIIVGAHFDHVEEGDGVVDNWSGASLLPSLYEALKTREHEHTYVFIGFTAEEKGELGSEFYARHMSKEEVAQTNAMVNMDTLGLGPSEVWLSHSDKHLANMLATVGQALKIPVTAVDVDQVGSTDSVQFSAKKIPSITVHTLTQKTWDAKILHTKKDQISEIHLDDYYETYRLLAAYLTALDRWLPLEGPNRK